MIMHRVVTGRIDEGVLRTGDILKDYVATGVYIYTYIYIYICIIYIYNMYNMYMVYMYNNKFELV